MKKQMVFLFVVFLCFLIGCGNQTVKQEDTTNVSWEFPAGNAPEKEYERLFWYEFAQENPEKNLNDTITEKELTDMLGKVVSARNGDISFWKRLTAGASDKNEVYRDYGAMLLLYANCELGWGGGCVASYSMDEITGYVAGIQRNGGVGGAGSSHNTFRNNYVHESYQEGLGIETATDFTGDEFDVTDNLFIGNVFYHCASSMIYFNWDEEANPNHQFRNITYQDNYVFYSGMSCWTDDEKGMVLTIKRNLWEYPDW